MKILLIICFAYFYVFSASAQNINPYSHNGHKTSGKKPNDSYDYNLYLKQRNPFYEILGYQRIQTLKKKDSYKIKSSRKPDALFVIEDCKLIDFHCFSDIGDTLNTGNFNNGDGTIILYDRNGFYLTIANFKKGLLEDTTYYYWMVDKQQKIVSKTVFKNGLLNGDATSYYPDDGILHSKTEYLNGDAIHYYYYGFEKDSWLFPYFSRILSKDKIHYEYWIDDKGKWWYRTYRIDGSIEREYSR